MVQVYLDCDGVLADFDKGAAAVFRMSPSEYEKRRGLATFWKALAAEPDFFSKLELLPDARELYEAVAHLEPIILTGLPRGNWAAPQKRRWSERYFPGVRVITTSAALKREHCHPGDILIDDRPKYRHLWEEAGGVFIPHTSAASSIAALRAHGILNPG
jgi:5'(3')-deoxyribonucleotidase